VQEVAAEVAGIHAATVTTNSNSKNRQGGDRDIGDERRKKKKEGILWLPEFPTLSSRVFFIQNELLLFFILSTTNSSRFLSSRGHCISACCTF